MMNSHLLLVQCVLARFNNNKFWDPWCSICYLFDHIEFQCLLIPLWNGLVGVLVWVMLLFCLVELLGLHGYGTWKCAYHWFISEVFLICSSDLMFFPCLMEIHVLAYLISLNYLLCFSLILTILPFLVVYVHFWLSSVGSSFSADIWNVTS